MLVGLLAAGLPSCAAGSSPAGPAKIGNVVSAQAGGPPAPIGVYHGPASLSAVNSFSKRLGRPVDLVHDYLDRRTWRSITNVSWLTEPWTKAGYAGRVVFTVPMLPDTGRNTLKAGAAGRYNKHFRTIAKRLVAGGHGSAVLRIGHEFNGKWFTWTINVPRGGQLYARYWRQIVRTMRSVKGARFKFDWAPVAGSGWINGGRRQLSAASAYPGNKWVDYIGLDVYDQSWAPDHRSASKRWKEFVNQRDGLAWHARFAAAHGKPMTFPEWALVKRPDGHGGGDSPYFIQKMHEWIEDHPVAYHLYFEHYDRGGRYAVFSGAFPNAAKSFVRLFGASVPASAPFAGAHGAPVVHSCEDDSGGASPCGPVKRIATSDTT